MWDLAVWVPFVVASLLLIVAPGPDILFLMTQSLSEGRKAGIATALGLSLGNLFHTALAVLGVALLIRNSPAAFNAVKFAGAAYLIYLAWQVLRHRHKEIRGGVATDQPPPRLFFRGLLMNVLNPKVVLFFLAFLPQFTDPSRGSVPLQMLVLGAAFTVLTALVFGSIGLFAGAVSERFLARRKAHPAFAWLVATVFLALALRLIWLSQ